jgi:hypothetical protein
MAAGAEPPRVGHLLGPLVHLSEDGLVRRFLIPPGQAMTSTAPHAYDSAPTWSGRLAPGEPFENVDSTLIVHQELRPSE